MIPELNFKNVLLIKTSKNGKELEERSATKAIQTHNSITFYCHFSRKGSFQCSLFLDEETCVYAFAVEIEA